MYWPIKPRGNRKIINTYVYHKAFTDEQCNKILSMLSDKWKDGNVDNVVNQQKQVLSADKDGFPFAQITNVVGELNRDWWNFDVTGLNLITDHPTVYKYSVDSHFGWHFDFTHVEPTRKLGYTIQLSHSSEYEGGSLEFFGNGINEKTRERGTLILFPSFVWHRVTKVTKGARIAMVGCIHGPSFQ